MAPFRQSLYGDARLVVWVDRVLVFPTGLMISLALFLSEDDLDGRYLAGRFPWGLTDEDEMALPFPMREQSIEAVDYFRFGVRYADGRSVATTTWEEHDAAHSALLDVTHLW